MRPTGEASDLHRISRPNLTAEAEALPGSIADYLGDMVSAHAPDGTYRYVSAASKELLGYEP
jgi:hypothetical protein